MIGKTIRQYEVLEKLGGGGMGVVYRAHDTRLDRDVALKFLPPHLSLDGGMQQRFVHEARSASALDHPSICTIHDIDQTEDGQLYIAMALYRGQTLLERIDRGPLPLDEALQQATRIAEALTAAHAAGIVHRDVKPANVILTDDGQTKLLRHLCGGFAGMGIAGDDPRLCVKTRVIRHGPDARADDHQIVTRHVRDRQNIGPPPFEPGQQIAPLHA